MKNPLIGPILTILKEHPNGIGEFDILKALKEQLTHFNKLADDANLQLFRQHFLIMNALYQLQTSLWQDEKMLLSINSTRIHLKDCSPNPTVHSTEVNDSVNVKLATYYLDWNEYKETDADDVSCLLNSFHQGLNLDNNKASALETLDLKSDNPTKSEIKSQYRKLAQKHHPDRGGNRETFIDLRQAYEYLML